MTTPHIHSEWEEKFEREFGPLFTLWNMVAKKNLGLGDGVDLSPKLAIKSFIRNLLTLSKKEAKEEVMKDICKNFSYLLETEMKADGTIGNAHRTLEGFINFFWTYAEQQGIELE